MTAPTMAAERSREADGLSDRRPRRRRRVRIVLVILVLLLGTAGVWLVWFSSALAVKDVRVVGVDGTRAEAVLSAAAVPVGVPLARIDADTPQRSVLALPWVQSVEVRRGWPTEVVIAVTARVPIASITRGDGAADRSAVDAQGVVFTPVGALPKGLPTVSGDGVGLTAAMAVLAELPADLAPRVVSLSATTRDNVDLTLRSGVLVHWGSAEQADAKAQVLRALMRHKADVYDVSAPELPTTFRAR